MSASHMAAASIELPQILSTVRSDRMTARRSSAHGADIRASPDSDVELVSMQGVVSREAGERDPLLLRTKIMKEDDLKGLKQ